MKALIIIVSLIVSFTRAEHKVHYPTDHPGVCNILAFVSDQVDVIAHMGKNETETINEITDRASRLANEILKVKRQVRDVMQVAQCPVSAMETKKKKDEPTDTLDVEPQGAESELREENESVVLTSTEKQAKTVKTSENSKEILTETISSAKLSSTQHVAETMLRPIRDVVHVLGSYLNSTDLKENNKSGEIQKNTKQTSEIIKEILPETTTLQPDVLQYVARPVRDVAHAVLASYTHTSDNLAEASQHVATHESAGNVADLLPPSFDQTPGFKARYRRHIEEGNIEESTEIRETTTSLNSGEESPYIQTIKPTANSKRTKRSKTVTSTTEQSATSTEKPDFIQDIEDPHEPQADNNSVIEIRHTRSNSPYGKPTNPEDTLIPEQFQTFKRIVRSNEVNSNVAVESTTPTESHSLQEDVGEHLKPTVKVHQSALPITQFAHRNTNKATRQTGEAGADHSDS